MLRLSKVAAGSFVTAVMASFIWMVLISRQAVNLPSTMLGVVWLATMLVAIATGIIALVQSTIKPLLR